MHVRILCVGCRVDSPQPMPLPPDRMRRSIAYYYYTREAPASQDCLGSDCENASRHSTLWQVPHGCKRCQEPACRRYPEAAR